MSDTAFIPATELAALVAKGEVSPVELITTYLERIDRLDGTINSFVTVAGDRALEEARRAERKLADGDDLPRFHGVPISIKDLNETAGIRTTFGSRAYADYVPDIDSSTVRRVKKAGFIVLGKTNTPEFGTIPITESELNGACRNPWDTDRTSGGSSGGGAAALAAGLCPISQGSDGGGSIRIPASCCGVFGMKPARGRVSLAPRLGEFPGGLATDGPIARTVRDAAALLDVMAGYEVGDPHWAPPPERPFEEEVGADPGRLRIGWTTANPIYAPVDPDCIAATEDAAHLLESLGHSVEEATPDWFDDDLVPAFTTLWQAITVMSGDPAPDLIEPINRMFATMAEQTPVAQYFRAVLKLQQVTRRVVAFWNDYDLLLTPTLALPPVEIGWLFQDEDPGMQFLKAGFFIPFTPEFNLTGQPAASLPLWWSDSGLPIGVQLVGPPAGEALLFRVCHQIEEARPWAERRPPVS